MSTSTGSIGAWLLGGALVASLGWNALSLKHATPPGTGCAGGSGGCVAAVEKLEASGGLGITPEKRTELLALLRECEQKGARNDARAAELAKELRSMLRDPAADPVAVRTRAQELGAVRAAAIEACVASSLELRKLLTPEQVGRLLDACCGDGCGESCGGGR